MFLCEHIKKFTSHTRKRTVIESDLNFIVFQKAGDVIADDWNAVLDDRNLFLDLKYLGILEQINKKNFQSRYVVIYDKQEPYAIAYFQVIDFVAGVFGDFLDSQVQDLKSKRTRLFERYIDNRKEEVIMRLLTCGNNLVSGEHAFLFKKDLKREEQFKVIEELIEKIGGKEKLRGKISAVLVKDFNTPLEKKQARCPFASEKFIEFNVEPNMVIDMPESVKSLNDYVGLFSKKYRNRAKSILKKREEFQIRDLTVDEVRKYNSEIYRLYENVYENAKFKLVKLPGNYFTECKENFPDKFYVSGYFRKDKLIAFSSGFDVEGNCLEAHYIGFDYELNKELELYQNILYHFVEIAISKNKRVVNLGRTAGEIKSTVGAKVQELTCYVKPQNTVSKVILKPFISFLQPGEWIPRNPFKEEALSY
jgi:hypothetical protein